MRKPNQKKARRNHKFKQAEFERLKGKCPYCKVDMTFTPNKRNSVSYDHIVAKARGGTHALSNGQIMCSECNSRKGGHSLEYFVKYRLWEVPRGPHLTLLNTQRHASIVGDIRTMRAMGKMCLANGL